MKVIIYTNYIHTLKKLCYNIRGSDYNNKLKAVWHNEQRNVISFTDYVTGN